MRLSCRVYNDFAQRCKQALCFSLLMIAVCDQHRKTNTSVPFLINHLRFGQRPKHIAGFTLSLHKAPGLAVTNHLSGPLFNWLSSGRLMKRSIRRMRDCLCSPCAWAYISLRTTKAGKLCSFAESIRTHASSRSTPPSLFSAITSLASNLLNYPKAGVIERRRFIRTERIIAVALSHNDFLDPMKDRFIVRFLSADSDELRPDVLAENHLVARITFDPVEEGADRVLEPAALAELMRDRLDHLLNGLAESILRTARPAVRVQHPPFTRFGFAIKRWFLVVRN